VVCVRRQQSRLSPPVWVSFQHLPTLSHNTLEEANALFVPLLTSERIGALKSQFCSRTQPRGMPSGVKGGFEQDALGTPQPLLTLPTLTSSHKFIPPKLRATKIWERCFDGKAGDLSAVNIFGAIVFVPLQPVHGPAIAAAPHWFYGIYFYRSPWTKWTLFIPYCRRQLRERKIYVTCPSLPWKSLAEICTPVSNLALQLVTIAAVIPGSASASLLSKQG